MVTAGLSSDVIIAKIKVSRCNFDTDPTQLMELKSKAVPNEVLHAMIEAPYGPPKTLKQPASVAPTPSERREETRQTLPSEPEYSTLEDIRALRKVFVRSEDDDSRSTIMRLLGGYEGVEVVNSATVAEIVLDSTTLTRDVAATRGGGDDGTKVATARLYNKARWDEIDCVDRNRNV